MNKLRETRLDKERSMQFIADELGITRQRYQQMEENPSRIRIDQAIAIGKALETDPSRIFFD